MVSVLELAKSLTSVHEKCTTWHVEKFREHIKIL